MHEGWYAIKQKKKKPKKQNRNWIHGQKFLSLQDTFKMNI